jgi:hypothetical protein
MTTTMQLAASLAVRFAAASGVEKRLFDREDFRGSWENASDEWRAEFREVRKQLDALRDQVIACGDAIASEMSTDAEAAQ